MKNKHNPFKTRSIEMKSQLEHYLKKHVELTPQEFEQFYSNFEHISIPKKGFLIHEGEICRHKFFLLEGLVRSYYIDENANEKITQFAIENWWITNLESFVFETPGKTYIQAIEATKVLRIRKEVLEDLYLTIPKLERFFRIITENMLIAIQRRNDFYLQLKSKERYHNLIEKLPDFAQRVPQYMIASYLDITPEYLSELRRT